MPLGAWRAALLGLGLAALPNGSTAMAQPERPARGAILSAEQGDIACYLRIRDEAGQVRRWMADFDVCGAAERTIGRVVGLRWTEANVMHPSCQGDPSCRRTQRVVLVSGIGR